MLKKILTVAGIAVLSTSLHAQEWYQEKGTLHAATMKEWCKADSKNKLATVGDFVAKGYNDKIFKPEIINALNKSGMNGVKILAQEVVNGLDESSCKGKKATKEMSNQEVSSNAVLLMKLMQWFK